MSRISSPRPGVPPFEWSDKFAIISNLDNIEARWRHSLRVKSGGSFLENMPNANLYRNAARDVAFMQSERANIEGKFGENAENIFSGA